MIIKDAINLNVKPKYVHNASDCFGKTMFAKIRSKMKDKRETIESSQMLKKKNATVAY